MGLLDLPIELLRPIIRDVVLPNNLPDCTRRWSNCNFISLARVNSVLEWEVFLLLQDHHFLERNEERPSPTCTQHLNFAPFIARYTTLVPSPKSAYWNDHFPALVHAVVDKIISLRPRPQTTTTPLRARYISTLCHRASLSLLATASIGAISHRKLKEHLLVAATHLHDLPVLAALLELDPNLSHTHSEYWGPPLKAAVLTGDANLARRFLLHGAQHEYPGWLDDIVRAPSAARLLAVLLPHHAGQSITHTSPRDVVAALTLATTIGKDAVATTLLHSQREAFGSASLAFYLRTPLLLPGCSDALRSAIIDAAGYIPSGGTRPRWTGPHLRQLLATACAAGHADTLAMLLARTKDLPNAVPPSSLIVPCVQADQLATLRVVLAAPGARLDAVSAMKLLARAAPWPPVSVPLLYLLQRKAVDVRGLLRVQERTGFGVAQVMSVAAQRGNVGLLEALTEMGVPLWDERFYAEAGCAVPVVVAEVWGQEGTGSALRERRDARAGEGVSGRDNREDESGYVRRRSEGEQSSGAVEVAPLATVVCRRPRARAPSATG